MMPYIPYPERDSLRLGAAPMTPGELAYVITTLCNQYVENKGLGYATLSTIVGVLESTKLEFYRRVIASYEDAKKDQNGDAF